MEEAAAQALSNARRELTNAQIALDDWRKLYGSRLFYSKRSGDAAGVKLAGACYDKINRLSDRLLTVIGKAQAVSTLLEATEKEINGE